MDDVEQMTATEADEPLLEAATQEQAPHEAATLEPEPTQSGPEAAGPEPVYDRMRWLAAAGTAVVLALPLVYLLVKSSAPKAPVNGTASGPAQAGPSVAALEQIERAAPTPANKINLSVAYINQQQPNRAAPLLNEVLAADPKNATAWNNLCVVHMQQQDIAAAVDSCAHAVSIAPDFKLAQNNLKWAAGELQKTQNDLDAIAKMAPSELTEAVYLREGLDDLHLERYDEAIAAWQGMLKTDPRSAVAANNIGTAYMLKKQAAQAVPWFEKAMTFDPTSQLAKNNMAWANGELAKPQEPPH